MAITYQESTRTFFLDGKGVTYAFCVNEYDYVEHLYFGKTIGHDDIRYVRGCGATDNNPKIPGVEMKVGYNYGALDSYQYFAPELAFFVSRRFRSRRNWVTVFPIFCTTAMRSCPPSLCPRVCLQCVMAKPWLSI